MRAFLDKEYGRDGGRRKVLSRADVSLVIAFAKDPTIEGIISEDKRDLEYGLYNYPNLGRPPVVLTAREFVNKYLR